MDNLAWQGNSKKMYDAILKETPALFVGIVKNSIAEWLAKNDIKVITEDLVFRAVDEIAPAALANNRIKPALEKLRTKRPLGK